MEEDALLPSERASNVLLVARLNCVMPYIPGKKALMETEKSFENAQTR